MIQVTKAENELLETVLRSKTPVTVTLPDDLPDDRLMPTIRSLCSLINKTERFENQSKQALGRCLSLMSARPELRLSLGYKSFEDWEQGEVIGKCGLERSTLRKIKRIETHFPSITPDRYSKIGTEKLNILCSFCSEGSGNCEPHLAKAEELTAEKLIEHAEKKGLLNKGEANSYVIKIPANREILKEWTKFLGEDFVKARMGSDDPSAKDVLRALIQDASSDPNWTDAKREE